jgi:hypothetical protein
MPEEIKRKQKEWRRREGYGGTTSTPRKGPESESASPRKLKTKRLQTLEEKVLDKTIVRKMTPTPGMKKKVSVGDRLKKVASDAKGKDAFSGVLSPKKVQERKGKKIIKTEARQAKNEAQTKKILSRKQKQAARRGQTVHIENLEKAKGSIGN